jgi:hypothetical protein
MNANETPLCPPHYWEVTSVRIDGVCHYHHRCKKCSAEKDVPSTSAGVSRWASRNPKNKR